jgi:uncharacterized protein YdiU (UPF0061 family)
MLKSKSDWTNTFATLNPGSALSPDAEFVSWHRDWTARLGRQPESIAEALPKMRAHNPVVIPRNHKVEEALAAASESRDLRMMHRLLKVLASPYDASADEAEYREPSPLAPGAYQTFCGT